MIYLSHILQRLACSYYAGVIRLHISLDDFFFLYPNTKVTKILMLICADHQAHRKPVIHSYKFRSDKDLFLRATILTFSDLFFLVQSYSMNCKSLFMN